MDHSLIYLVHILIVGPLLAYVGYNGVKTDQTLFNILYALGVGVSLYHAYMYYQLKKMQNATTLNNVNNSNNNRN